MFRGALGGANYDRLAMTLNGTVAGASDVSVDAIRTYSAYTVVDADAINTIQANTSAFAEGDTAMTLRNSLVSGLNGVAEGTFHLRPTLLIENPTGDLTLAGNWNNADWDYGERRAHSSSVPPGPSTWPGASP